MNRLLTIGIAGLGSIGTAISVIFWAGLSRIKPGELLINPAGAGSGWQEEY